MQSTAQSPILSAGELLWDLLPSGPRLGGTTSNFAILSARLGDFVALVSRIGDDEFGQLALDRLNAVATQASIRGHFDLRAIQTSTHLPTGTVTITFDPQQRPAYTIECPVAWDEIQLSPQIFDLAGAASAICYGTLAQRHNPSRQSIRGLIAASSPECVRVCDVNLRLPFCTAATLEWSVANATVLKVSDEELPAVARLLAIPDLGPCPAHDPTATSAWACENARLLLRFAPRCHVIAITLGPHGSLLASRNHTHRHPGFPIRVADTIGAGDAFTAGLVHAYVRGASLAQISTVSNLCGSFVASQPGATPDMPPSLLHAIELTLQQPGA